MVFCLYFILGMMFDILREDSLTTLAFLTSNTLEIGATQQSSEEPYEPDSLKDSYSLDYFGRLSLVYFGRLSL
jgi:hypothetical protein